MMLLHTVAAFIAALGVLIVVHEYGHYLAARMCGVKVLRFSVGFGHPVVRRRFGSDGTEWVIAAIPFGGYVKMLDEREAPVYLEEAHRAFNRQNVWKRILIVAAGPAFNFFFAIMVYAGLYMHGLPEARPVVAEPPPESIASRAGVRAGDTIRSVDGESIETWQEFRWRLIEAALQSRSLTVEVAGEGALRGIATLKIDLSSVQSEDVGGNLMDTTGFGLFRPRLDPVIGQVVPGSPAELAGLRPGDRITQAASRSLDSWESLVQAIRGSPQKPLRLAVERDGLTLLIEVIPDAIEAGGEHVGRIGAAPAVPAGHANRIFIRVSHGALESLRKAALKTRDIALFSLRMFGKMLMGEVSWKHLSGPVTIADFAGQSAQLGWVSYLTFLCLISISLGVLNLLPVPLLDGGHLMYYAVEIIKGSPLSERAMELGQRVGFALLLVMMAFAFYNDINRLFSS